MDNLLFLVGGDSLCATLKQPTKYIISPAVDKNTLNAVPSTRKEAIVLICNMGNLNTSQSLIANEITQLQQESSGIFTVEELNILWYHYLTVTGASSGSKITRK